MIKILGQRLPNNEYGSHIESSRGTIPFLTNNDCYNLFLILLVVIGTLYYCLFSFSIVMPQLGWWQYFGYRIVNGDIPYKDFYLFLPPYYALYSAILYLLFGKHIFLYTLYGLVINKIFCWVLLYSLLTRKFKPWQATVGMLVGIACNSVYLMDLTCDYNPTMTLLWVLIIYCLVKVFEIEANKNQKYTFFVGVICGVLLMSKQNVGLFAPVMSVAALALISYKKADSFLKAIRLLIWGFLVGLCPGVIYLIVTDSITSALNCISSALGAKGMGTGIVITTLRNFWRPSFLAIAFLICGIYFLLKKNGKDVQKALLCIIVSMFLGIDTNIYLVPLWAFLNNNTTPFLSTFVVLLVMLFGISIFVIYKREKRISNLRYGLFYVALLTVSFGLVLLMRVDQRRSLTSALGIIDLRRGLLYAIVYLEIFLWIDLTKKLIKKERRINISYYLTITCLLIYVGISFTSATLEELYAITFVPLAVCEFLNREFLNERIKVYTTLVCSIVVVCLCLMEKTYLPYEWHSWRVPSLYDSENPMVISNIDGLKGMIIPESDEIAYEEIIAGIEKYSDKSDIVYQFPNVMLFNVLTERKTIYDAIPYFDVCPDEEAHNSVDYLMNNPPEIVIWSDLNETRWSIHEYQYRNGHKSGQRDIQRWFNTYVKNNYYLIGSWDNNEEEEDTISLWKLMAYVSGTIADEWMLPSGESSFSQIVYFYKDQFSTYYIKADTNGNIEDIPISIKLKSITGETVDETVGYMKKEEDGWCSIKAENDISVSKGVAYILKIQISSSTPIIIGRTADNSATAEEYAFDDDYRYNYLAGIRCD